MLSTRKYYSCKVNTFDTFDRVNLRCLCFIFVWHIYVFLLLQNINTLVKTDVSFDIAYKTSTNKILKFQNSFNSSNQKISFIKVKIIYEICSMVFKCQKSESFHFYKAILHFILLKLSLWSVRNWLCFMLARKNKKNIPLRKI